MVLVALSKKHCDSKNIEVDYKLLFVKWNKNPKALNYVQNVTVVLCYSSFGHLLNIGAMSLLNSNTDASNLHLF